MRAWEIQHQEKEVIDGSFPQWPERTSSPGYSGGGWDRFRLGPVASEERLQANGTNAWVRRPGIKSFSRSISFDVSQAGFEIGALEDRIGAASGNRGRSLLQVRLELGNSFPPWEALEPHCPPHSRPSTLPFSYTVPMWDNMSTSLS